jgi:hypothetical protein
MLKIGVGRLRSHAYELFAIKNLPLAYRMRLEYFVEQMDLPGDNCEHETIILDDQFSCRAKGIDDAVNDQKNPKNAVGINQAAEELRKRYTK